MRKLYVTYEMNCFEDTSNHYGPGAYDYEWSTRYDPELTAVYSEFPENFQFSYEKFSVDFDSTEVYVLAVVYSSGDTFGNSSGNLAIVGIYETIEQAREIEKSILSNTFDPEKYHPWGGYFERIEEIKIEKFGVM